MAVFVRSDCKDDTHRERLESDFIGKTVFACDFYVPGI
jgi:hypothetical protein